jgi:hypothetical protein
MTNELVTVFTGKAHLDTTHQYAQDDSQVDITASHSLQTAKYAIIWRQQ